MRLHLFLKPFALFISLAVCLTSYAATYKKLDLPSLALKADGLVYGTVTDIYSGFDEKDDLVTWVEFSDLEIISGSYTEQTLTLKFCGGEFNGLTLSCSTYSDFDVDDKVYMYIKENPEFGTSSLVGGTQGLFFVTGSEDDPEVEDPVSHQFNENVNDTSVESGYVQDFDESNNDQQVGPPMRIQSKQSVTAQKRSLKQFLDTVKHLPTQHKLLRSASMKGLKSVNRRYPRLRSAKHGANDHFEQEFFASEPEKGIKNIRRYYASFGIPVNDINRVIAKHRKGHSMKSSMNRAKRKALIDDLELALKSFMTRDKYDAALLRYKKGRLKSQKLISQATSNSDEQSNPTTVQEGEL